MEDWELLMTRCLSRIPNALHFENIVHLCPTVEAVAEHNIGKLIKNNRQLIVIIKAVHSGPNAAKATLDDAGGLEPVIIIANSARVMVITGSRKIWRKIKVVVAVYLSTVQPGVFFQMAVNLN